MLLMTPRTWVRIVSDVSCVTPLYLTIMTQVLETFKQPDLELDVLGRVLQSDFPTALRRCPATRALVFADLELERGRDNVCRDAFHSIGFVKLGVDLVQTLEVCLQLGVAAPLGGAQIHDALLKVSQ